MSGPFTSTSPDEATYSCGPNFEIKQKTFKAVKTSNTGLIGQSSDEDEGFYGQSRRSSTSSRLGLCLL